MRKKYMPRSVFLGKENLESDLLETEAQEKLNTFSEDRVEISRNETDEFSGWADDNILLERVNREHKPRKSPYYDTRKNNDTSIRIFINRKLMDSKRRIMEEQIEEDSKAEIYLLKKQAEFLEGSGLSGPVTGQNGKFPKKEDFINTASSRSPQMNCYPTHNNFFSSRQKYSARQTNRKIIKNIRKLSLKYPHNNFSSLLTPTLVRMRASERKGQDRPSSGNHAHKSHRVHSEKADYSIKQPLTDIESSRPTRYIPSSFKKCRMNKRNKSARVNMSEPAELNQTFRNQYKNQHYIKGKRMKPQGGPLDDLLKIRFPDFF